MNLSKVIPTIEEMKMKEIDVLTYSFCFQDQAFVYYGNDDILDGDLIYWFEHTTQNNEVIQKNIPGGIRLISYASIIKNSVFQKVLFENKIFIWPKETPFDFEIYPTEIQFLPLKRAIPKYELFASIDSDNGVPGTSLISRGLYIERIPRQSYAEDFVNTRGITFDITSKLKKIIIKYF